MMRSGNAVPDEKIGSRCEAIIPARSVPPMHPTEASALPARGWMNPTATDSLFGESLPNCHLPRSTKHGLSANNSFHARFTVLFP